MDVANSDVTFPAHLPKGEQHVRRASFLPIDTMSPPKIADPFPHYLLCFSNGGEKVARAKPSGPEAGPVFLGVTVALVCFRCTLGTLKMEGYIFFLNTYQAERVYFI